MGDGVNTQVLRVRGLHLILLEWLHLDDMLVGVHARRVVITRDVLCYCISSSRLVRIGRGQGLGGYDTYHEEHGDQQRSHVSLKNQRETVDGLSCLMRTWWKSSC